jgi:hypothetical protein
VEEAGGEEGDILGYFRYEGILDRGASSRDADREVLRSLQYLYFISLFFYGGVVSKVY